MMPCLADGSIKSHSLLDYHDSILRRRGIAAKDIEVARLLSAGMRRVDKRAESDGLRSVCNQRLLIAQPRGPADA